MDSAQSGSVKVDVGGLRTERVPIKVPIKFSSYCCHILGED